jgi:hypothetical protein
MNCWQFKNCGREPEGANVPKLGCCPAAIEESTEGINGGHNAGRCCWVVAGTYCGGKVQGTLAAKLLDCMHCDFFTLVVRSEGRQYQGVKEIQEIIKEKRKLKK